MEELEESVAHQLSLEPSALQDNGREDLTILLEVGPDSFVHLVLLHVALEVANEDAAAPSGPVTVALVRHFDVFAIPIELGSELLECFLAAITRVELDEGALRTLSRILMVWVDLWLVDGADFAKLSELLADLLSRHRIGNVEDADSVLGKVRNAIVDRAELPSVVAVAGVFVVEESHAEDRLDGQLLTG